MTKQEKQSLLVVAALAFAGYTVWMRRQVPAAQLPAGDVWGGGLPVQLPDVITDYFGGRSVDQVLANPGPLFQREVLDYRPEGLNYPAPATSGGASGGW